MSSESGAASAAGSAFNGWRMVAVGAVLLAFLLRAVNLGAQSIWYDEAFSLLLARYGYSEIVARTARDTMPPLYYWLLHLWGTGPPADFYPRFLSVMAGTCSVALVYAVGKLLVDARTGAVAALFAAVAPFQVFYGQEVRMYALLGLWALLAVFGFLLGWQRGSRRGWALYALATALAVYTHALGWLPSAALFGWGLLTAYRAPARLAPPLLALGTALLAYLPWLTVMLGQARQVLTSFWASPPSFVSPFASLYLFFEGPFVGYSLFPAVLGLVLVALGLTVPPMLPPKAGADRLALSFLWAWLAFPLLALYLASQVQSVYLERVVIGAAFPVYLLLGWVATRPWSEAPGRLGALLGLLVLLAGLWGLRNWYSDPDVGKPPQREAARAVQAAWQPGQPVLHSSDGSLFPFLLYAPDLPNRLLDGDPEYASRTARARSTHEALGVQPVSRDTALKGAQRFFLVVALDHSVEYQVGLAKEFDARYERLSEDSVGGILVRVYARR